MDPTMDAAIWKFDVKTSQQEVSQLKNKLRRAERMNHLRSYLMIAPLFVFIAVTFLVPIGMMLYKSVYDPVISRHLPETVAQLRGWDPTRQAVPDAAAFDALAADMVAAAHHDAIPKIASRLNFESGGMLSLFMRTARMVKKEAAAAPASHDWKQRFIALDPAWATPRPWAIIKRLGHVYTAGYYAQALDLKYKVNGSLERQPSSSRLYVGVFGRTAWVGLLVTGACLLLGYPLAYLLANLSPKKGNLLMIMVLLPFWTSLLVRTTAWIVLLQSDGVINKFLLWLGLIQHPLNLVYNRIGVVVTMTHILLPFMVLPLFSVMKAIPPSYARAARSLGAGPWRAFWQVYFPQSMPGISAGVLLVFILSIGYYITPALVGGPADQMISYFIADNLSRSLNWGLAAALGGILLASVLLLYSVYERFVGIANVKLG